MQATYSLNLVSMYKVLLDHALLDRDCPTAEVEHAIPANAPYRHAIPLNSSSADPEFRPRGGGVLLDDQGEEGQRRCATTQQVTECSDEREVGVDREGYVERKRKEMRCEIAITASWGCSVS